jgi:hypothetical protein
MASVRELLDNLQQRWPTLSVRVKNELLGLFLERIELSHDRATLRLRLRWITGREQVFEINRPDYRPAREEHWTAEEDASLVERYASVPWGELQAALPDRSENSIRTRAARRGLRRSVRGTPRIARARHEWGADEEALIRRYAAGELGWGELRHLTGRTEAALRARHRILVSRERAGHRDAPFAGASWTNGTISLN